MDLVIISNFIIWALPFVLIACGILGVFMLLARATYRFSVGKPAST